MVDDKKMLQNTNTRYEWITIANVFACFGVIMLHCNGIFWSFPRGITWYTACFIETFFFWPVPIFFMISGITLINYRDRYSTSKYLKKRFVRTGIPFLFWSFFSVIYRVYISHWEWEGIGKTIEGIINTRYMEVYWFFIPLFAVYLSIPFLALINEDSRIRIFIYTSIIAFLTISLLPTIFNFAGIQYNYAIQLPVCGGYILYVLIGYLIANLDLSKPIRYLLYLSGIIGWLFHYIGTTICSFKAGEISDTFKGYMNFPTVLQATGIMIAFKYFPWNRVLGKKGLSVFKNLGNFTFGIYLIHFYLVDCIPYMLKINTGSMLWRTAGALAIFLVCSGSCMIISKIPFLRKVIGV